MVVVDDNEACGAEAAGRGRTADPADRAQLERAPVPLRRVTALFRPYRGQVATVVALIVASSTVALATPFLVRRRHRRGPARRRTSRC